MTPRTVAFHTLGCKLNFSETSAIAQLFEKGGYRAIEFDEGADVYVINTCSVTDFADRKCRQIVRRALGIAPQAFVIVVGCYAQLKPTEIADIEGVDLVLGAAEKFRILDYVDDLTKSTSKGMVQAGAIRDAREFTAAFSLSDRTRSFLKVQDGCDYKCSFCTIPLARGASRSDTVANVVQNANSIAATGTKEIILTGVNLGDFGNSTAVIEGTLPKDTPKTATFYDLLETLDASVSRDIARFRISSIEPNLLTEEIIGLVAASSRFVPHFHLPLQSGNNKQLAAMRRRYRRELYADRIASIRAALPHAAIGVDVIVGFPDETDADFEETFNFIHTLDVSYLHVFTYSERPNTPAATMPNPVPMHRRRERNERLRILSEKKRHAFYEQYVGTTRPVLWEAEQAGVTMQGYTDNYIRVTLPYRPELVNTIVPTRLEGFDKNGDVAGQLPVISHSLPVAGA